MQVVDWIDRHEWTDDPPCVHPVLQRLAIGANDSLNDEERQKLLDMAPRLMNTASTDKRLSVQLAVFCAEWVLPIFEARNPADERPRKAIQAARDWLSAANDAAYAAHAAEAAHDAHRGAAEAAHDARRGGAYAAHDAAYAAYAAAYAAHDAAYAAYAAHAAAYAYAAKKDLLVAALDEYDRLTGRNQIHELDYAPVCAAMSPTGSAES
jgi:hypothetical protein